MTHLLKMFSSFPFSHHAYGIESLGNTIGNSIKQIIPANECSYIFHRHYDRLLIDDVREIRSLQSQKTSLASVFIIEFSLINTESQNALLKIIEEPTPNTYFIFIFPDKSHLLPTILSRLEILSHTKDELSDSENMDPNPLQAEAYCKMSLEERFSKNKELTDKKNPNPLTKTQLLQFLDALEVFIRASGDASPDSYQSIYDARGYIHAKGASAKMILDMVALHLS